VGLIVHGNSTAPLWRRQDSLGLIEAYGAARNAGYGSQLVDCILQFRFGINIDTRTLGRDFWHSLFRKLIFISIVHCFLEITVTVISVIVKRKRAFEPDRHAALDLEQIPKGTEHRAASEATGVFGICS
jgi:hypothetical protein